MPDLTVSEIIDKYDLLRRCPYCFDYLQDPPVCCEEQPLRRHINIIEDAVEILVINGVIGMSAAEVKTVFALAKECLLRRMCERHSGVPVKIDTAPK